jgi:hypothetical protein
MRFARLMMRYDFIFRILDENAIEEIGENTFANLRALQTL